MKKITLLFLLLGIVPLSFGQVISSDPSLPTSNEAITLYFHADEGTGGLADYSGDIYAHIGLITSESSSSSDWKYVKAEWSENIPACKLTKVSINLYSLLLSPDLYTYFDCPTTETIEQIAMVFRSADGSQEGKDDGSKDIYVTIYEAGLNVSFDIDASYLVEQENTTVSFSAQSSLESTLEILVDDVVKQTVISGTQITYSETFVTSGDYQVVVRSTYNGQSVADTLNVYVIGSPVEASLPADIRDGINYSGDSVTLVLNAPDKESVVLIGDFNNWTPSNDYLLKKDGTRWWITLDNLTPKEEYAYQYLVDLELTVADPYAEKVLDPWNDQYISTTTYPDLKSYPTGADGIVSVLQTNQDTYTWDTEDFTIPSNDDLVVYELLIRDFVASQDIKDVIQKLDYLDELGVTAIELMPVSEFEGNNSWGYNPSFYLAFDKNYGTRQNFKMFVDSCHARGMAVIMDITLNHAFYQSPLVQLYFDEENDRPAEDNPWFNATSPNTAYSWGADFDHESPYTEYYVDRIVEHWMSEYRIDGYRFDFTKGFTNTGGDGWAYDQSRIDNLKRIYDNFQAVNPETYNLMILEHFSELSEEKILADYGMLIWGNNNNAYMQCAMGWPGESSIASVSHQSKGYDYPNLVGYMESHDEERMMFKNITYGNSSGDYDVTELGTALDRAELATAFFLTVPGPKMIWQFGELGYDITIGDDERVDPKPIMWEYYDDEDRRDLYDVYAKLNALRAEYDVFSTSDFTIDEMTNFTKRITLNGSDLDVIVIGNFDVEAQSVSPEFTETGVWYEFFTDDSITVSSTDMAIELQPGEYRLYANARLAVSPIKDVDLPVKDVEELQFKVYPNPVNDILTIEAEQVVSEVIIYTVSGQTILSQPCSSKHVSVAVRDLKQGVYLLQLMTGDSSEITRVIIE